MKSKRPRWKVIAATAGGIFVAGVGLLATAPAAFDTIADAAGWVGDRFDGKPSHADVTVDRFIKETTTEGVDWSHGPTIAEPSVDYFRRHFDTLDPERVHPLSIKDVRGYGDVGGLATNAPNLVGRLLLIRGRVASAMQTGSYGSVTSWVFELYDRKPTDPVTVFCRVPLPTDTPPDFAPGELVSATGVLIADGAIEGARGKPRRLLYMACSAIGTSVRFTSKPPRRAMTP